MMLCVGDAADEARRIWTELGSPPMLARLDAGLARWRGEAPVASKAAQKLEPSASI